MTDTLPPLPEPEIWVREEFGLGDTTTHIGYSEEQMRAYAAAAVAASEVEPSMTAEEARAGQSWACMDGATAYLLIQRHADGWADTRLMMDAWLSANIAAAVVAERNACAALCDALNRKLTDFPIRPLSDAAEAIRARKP